MTTFHRYLYGIHLITIHLKSLYYYGKKMAISLLNQSLFSLIDLKIFIELYPDIMELMHKIAL